MNSERIEAFCKLADSLHQKGYNCAQAVGCALSPLFGVSEQESFRALEGFGFGMGNSCGVCGAVSGAVYLAGLANSDGNTEQPASKKATYRLSAAILTAFSQRNQSLICRDLKGMDTGTPLRSCAGCIEDAVRISLEILSPYIKNEQENLS